LDFGFFPFEKLLAFEDIFLIVLVTVFIKLIYLLFVNSLVEKIIMGIFEFFIESDSRYFNDTVNRARNIAYGSFFIYKNGVKNILVDFPVFLMSFFFLSMILSKYGEEIDIDWAIVILGGAAVFWAIKRITENVATSFDTDLRSSETFVSGITTQLSLFLSASLKPIFATMIRSTNSNFSRTRLKYFASNSILDASFDAFSLLALAFTIDYIAGSADNSAHWVIVFLVFVMPMFIGSAVELIVNFPSINIVSRSFKELFVEAYFSPSQGKIRAMKPVSIAIAKQDDCINIPVGITRIHGKSGSGKSTVLKLLAYGDPKGQFRIYFDGVPSDAPYRQFKLDFIQGDFEVTSEFCKIGLQLIQKFETDGRLLTELGLDELGQSQSDFSRGEKLRILLGLSVVKRVDCLIIDDAITTLDKEMRELVLMVLRERMCFSFIIVSSHEKLQVSNVLDINLEQKKDWIEGYFSID
jgi:ABC-type lipoprotein export system ATPase subunit